MNGNDEQKFMEMIKYISSLSLEDEKFGRTKLNKILFFCDFLAYRDLGHSISGEMYHKEPFGPVPHRISTVLNQLIKEQEMAEVPRMYGGYNQFKPVVLKSCDLNCFDPNEVSLMDFVVSVLRVSNASEVSDLSHQFHGWQLAEMGEEIPYETVLLQPSEVTQDDIEYGKHLLEEMKNDTVFA